MALATLQLMSLHPRLVLLDSSSCRVERELGDREEQVTAARINHNGRYRAALRCAVLCCAVLCCAFESFAVLCCDEQCSVPLHIAVQFIVRAV